MISGIRTGLLATTALVTLAHPAVARQSAQSAEGAVVIEEVIVTAQKREQRLLDVPQSVSVISAQALETVQAPVRRLFHPRAQR